MFPRRFLLLFFLLSLWLPRAAVLANEAPVFQSLASVAPLRAGGDVRQVDLTGSFIDPDVTGTVMQVNVRIGTQTQPVNIALYDQQTPITVANFRRYVSDGKFAGSFFHRLAAGFVVQGGGFAWNADGSYGAIVTYPAIQNEPGISNVRGTVAMAKLGGDPNSATSQWFVNLADNSANLNAQNGGFTVFGRVLGNGMAVMDQVAALKVYNFGSPLDTLPLSGVPGNTFTRPLTIETNFAEIPALTYTADSGDPGLVAATVVGSTLQLTPGATRSGTAQITLHATDLDGATTDQIISVQVQPRSANWRVVSGADGSGDIYVLDPTNTAGLSGDAVPIAFDGLTVGDSESRTFTIRNDGNATLTGLSLTLQGSQANEFAITTPLASSSLAGGASASFTVTFSPAPSGTRQATLRVGTTNADVASFDLDLSAPPVLSGVASQVLTADADGTATVPDWRGNPVTATDASGVNSFTQSPAPGTVEPIGSYPLIFTAIDSEGLSSSATATLQVVFPRPSAVQVQTTGGYAGAPVPQAGGSDLPAGSALSTFGTPAIGDRRHLAARVTIKAGAQRLAGLYLEDGSGQSTLVAHQNAPSGIAGASFKSFLDPVLSGHGNIAFCATVSGVPATGNQGVWTDLFGTLAPVLRTGVAIPQLGLKLKSVTSIALTNDALVALVKVSAQPGVVVAGVSDTVLLRMTSPSTVTLLARTGGLFQGSVVKRLAVLQPAAKSAGQGRWSGADATVVNLVLQNSRTVLIQLDAHGIPTTLLQAGVEDPDFPVRLAQLGLPAIGGSGVAVLATKAPGVGIKATNNTALLFAPDSSAFSEVATENTSAGVAGGGVFASFSDPVTNDQGEVLFFATLRGGQGTGANLGGLWQTAAGGSPELVARLGATAVDGEGAAMAGTNWSTIDSFALPDGSGAGAVFTGKLTGTGVKPSTNRGLWATDSTGLLRLAMRTGGKVTLASGDKTVIAFTVLNALPGSFGARRSYNGSGSLAVQATFSDGTQAVLRLDLP